MISSLTLDAFVGGELLYSWAHSERDPNTLSALTEIFGYSPTIDTTPQSFEGGFIDQSTASWTGFDITWFPNGPFRGTSVSTRVAMVGGVEILSVDGSSIGDDLQSLAQINSDDAFLEFEVLHVYVGAVPSIDPEVPFPEFAISVDVAGTAPFDKVTHIRAPHKNFGI